MNNLSDDDLRKLAPKLLAMNIQAARPSVVAPSVEGGFGGKASWEDALPPVSASTEVANEEPKSKQRRNDVWDVCEEVLGYGPATDSEKSLWGKKVTSLRRAEATPDKIRSVAEWYHRKWPGIDLTITALEKWYSHFLRLSDQKTKAKVVCPECEMGGGNHAADCSKAPAARSPIAILPLNHEAMVPLVDQVRAGAHTTSDDLLRVALKPAIDRHPQLGQGELDELIRYAGVIRAMGNLGA